MIAQYISIKHTLKNTIGGYCDIRSEKQDAGNERPVWLIEGCERDMMM